MNPQQPEDAEIVSEGPKPPPPPPRVAELKPAAAGEAFSVFDGPVDEAKNAKRKPKEGAPRPRPAAKGKGRAQKPPPAAAAPGAAAPAPDPEVMRRLQAEAEARELLLMYEAWQLGMVGNRYAELLGPHGLEQLQRALKYPPEVLQRLSSSLGRGMAENEVELPWWVTFGALFGADLIAKRMMLSQIEQAYQEREKQKEAAAAPSSPATTAAAA